MLEAALEGATSNILSAGPDLSLFDDMTEFHTTTTDLDPVQLQYSENGATGTTSEEAWHESTISSQDVSFCNSRFSPLQCHNSQFMLVDPAWSGEVNGFETFHTPIPDDRVLDVPELECLSTAMVFAKLLNCEDTVWNPAASRTLDLPPSAVALLPVNLQPTSAQRRIAHHPIFDLLPWPSVRTRFICVFAQPVELRPPNARDEMAILRLVYDFDDPVEGLKVSGADRVDTRNWEIGQQVFPNWWWAFDHETFASSNALRMKRGADRLRITPT